MWFSVSPKPARSGPAAAAVGLSQAGGEREHNKGAVRMKLWAGVVRRVGVAVFLLGGMIVATAIGSIAVAESAAAQQIVVQGNRRVEAGTIQSYFRLGSGERLDDIKLDNAYKALINTGLFQDV